MTRRELQQLARARLRDAQILLRARRFGGAYYLCGYVVECALKACIAKQTRRYDFPDRDAVQRSWTHDPTQLLRTAGLQSELEQDMRTDRALQGYWGIVAGWRETSRYERRSRADAQALYAAISDDQHGVFRWLQQYW